MVNRQKTGVETPDSLTTNKINAMTPWDEFDLMMKKHNDSYINEFGILFRKESKFIFVDAPWPGYSNSEIISIVALCHDGKHLFEELSIEAADELYKLQPEILLNLFYAGRAMVLCALNDVNSLEFEKIGDTLYAINDDAERGHEVKEQLLLPGDFIRYTRNYFRFVNEQKKNQ